MKHLETWAITPSQFQEFKASFCRIIRNPLIICGCGSSVFSVLGVVGYVIWLPKYFEHEFRKTKSSSALFSGKKKKSRKPIHHPPPPITSHPPSLFNQVYRVIWVWFSECSSAAFLWAATGPAPVPSPLTSPHRNSSTPSVFFTSCCSTAGSKMICPGHWRPTEGTRPLAFLSPPPFPLPLTAH